MAVAMRSYPNQYDLINNKLLRGSPCQEETVEYILEDKVKHHFNCHRITRKCNISPKLIFFILFK